MEEVFKFHFNNNKTRGIRNSLEEIEIFATQKENIVKVMEPSKKRKFEKKDKVVQSYDVIYASLDRIDDTLEYINSLILRKNPNMRSAFDFFEFLNNMYVVIGCIKTLGHVFDVPIDEYKKIETSLECFDRPGIDNLGSDNEFFEYVRSLASVHPVNTGMHPAYHGYQKFHCSPFAVWTQPSNVADISLYIYDSEDSIGMVLYLRIIEFEKYLQKWINFIDIITIYVNNHNLKVVENYKNKRIKTEEEFNKYSEYLLNLQSELCLRVGEIDDYFIDYYIMIFEISMSNKINDSRLELYRNAIKYSMKFLHNRLQEMSKNGNTGILYPSNNVDTELFVELWKPRSQNVMNYGYNLEKMHYLDDSGSSNERFARTLLENMKDFINKYVFFSNSESANETQILVSMAMYFDCLENPTLINKNIPNSLEYRNSVLSPKEWDKLIACK